VRFDPAASEVIIAKSQNVYHARLAYVYDFNKYIVKHYRFWGVFREKNHSKQNKQEAGTTFQNKTNKKVKAV
jgi:hypothetical protein